jgi:hypothetical protein
MNARFLEIARDARLIPGVHHYCDEWCDRCPHTRRCLAFRCEAAYRKLKGRNGGEPTFRSTREASDFARQLAAVEARQMPDAGSQPAGQTQASGSKTHDPLVYMAWEYALGVSMWLVLSPEDLRKLRVGAAPSSEEVVLWFHLRIYLKLVRAVAAQDRPLTDVRATSDEANGYAKLTLVSVRRSRKALLQLKAEGAPAAGPLRTLLDRLEHGIDERFPDAGAFVRIGLDVPAA